MAVATAPTTRWTEPLSALPLDLTGLSMQGIDPSLAEVSFGDEDVDDTITIEVRSIAFTIEQEAP